MTLALMALFLVLAGGSVWLLTARPRPRHDAGTPPPPPPPPARPLGPEDDPDFLNQLRRRQAGE